MSIRTTVTLDEDVLERVKAESRVKGESFKDTLNDLLRFALVKQDEKPRRRTLKIVPIAMGYREELNHSSIGSLLEYAEGDKYR